MRIDWKRYTLGAFLLASLSLLLFGCSDYSATPVAQTKTISGVVSDPATGLALPKATVTAYAIDSNGVRSTTPLSVTPTSTTTDAYGKYSLKIPAAYAGSVMIEAIPASSAAKLAKALLAPAPGKPIRSLIPKTLIAQATIPPVMVSFATESVVLFLEISVTPSPASTAAGFTPVTVFSSDNIQKAMVVLETFFGTNFSQIPPPTGGDLEGSTKAQQDLVVAIQAVNNVVTDSGQTTTQVVSQLAAPTGLGELAAQITTAITAVEAVLVDSLPPEYVISTTITASITAATSAPAPVPDLTVVTPLTAPTNLIATAVNEKTVGLTWAAGTGVAGYSIYRADAATPYAVIDTVGAAATSYTDISAAPATQYSYQIVAFDAARNNSGPSNEATVTTPAVQVTPPVSSTFFIFGKITVNGTALAGAVVNVTGSGTGSVATDVNGNYTIPVLNGSYVLTPVLAGYAFTPVTLAVSVSGADVTGQDFSALLTGSVTGGGTFPDGSVTGGVTYPDGSVTSVATYPNGTIIGGVSYPAGTIIGSVTYPSGTVIGGVTYPAGTIIGSVIYPNGTVVVGVIYPTGLIVGGATFPAGAVSGTITYPDGSLASLLLWDTGTTSGATNVTVSGTVTAAGAAFSGVTLHITGGAGVDMYASSGATGGYYFLAPAGSYTVTPSRAGYTFTPASLTVVVGSGYTSLTGQNFTSP